MMPLRISATSNPCSRRSPRPSSKASIPPLSRLRSDKQFLLTRGISPVSVLTSGSGYKEKKMKGERRRKRKGKERSPSERGRGEREVSLSVVVKSLMERG